MSHRRRFLNLVMENRVNGVYTLSLRRVDLHSRQNNLFYPSAAAAEDAAAAHDPETLSSIDRRNMSSAVKKLKPIRLAAAAGTMMNFQPAQYATSLKTHCVGLSESRTAFMAPGSFGGAFVYDADERCVTGLPSLRGGRRWPPVLLSAAGDGVREGDRIYILESYLEPAARGTEEEDRFQIQALVHPPWSCFGIGRRWRYGDELPPPPDDVGNVSVDAYVLVTTGASDVICVSKQIAGIYCLDTKTHAWSKAGDRPLPFAGKVEHDADLGVWVGFLDTLARVFSYYNTVCASSGDLFSAADSHTSRKLLCRDPPYEEVSLDTRREPQIVGLGSGKFCVVQFFRTAKGSCCSGSDDDDDEGDRFAVFTGVEVMRCGSGGDDGYAAFCKREGELRIVFHKSKRYMFVPGLPLS